MPIGFALAETGRTRKLYGASTGAHQFQRSSVVERSAVNFFQEHFRLFAFSLRESIKTRFLEGKQQSKPAIPTTSHIIL